jgi:hypothetical protein
MKSLYVFALCCITAAVLLTACSDDPADPVEPDVAAPTALRASSAEQSIILSWTPSSSENQDNFDGYKVVALNRSTNVSKTVYTTAGDGFVFTGLDNGTRYQFTVRAVSTSGKESQGAVTIEWAPAARRYVDVNDEPIRVYATTSKLPSAVDLYNPDGKTEVIDQSGEEFRLRGDFYVYAPDNSTNYLKLVSPDQANNQGQETDFSEVSPYRVDDLDANVTTVPPALSTYKLKELVITALTSETGMVYYGRIKRQNEYNYFRLLILRGANGSLVQGSGDDRYVEMQVSFQHVRNLNYAKQ